MGLTREEAEDLRAESRKEIEQAKRDIDQRHGQLIATLKSMQQSSAGYRGAPQWGFKDAVMKVLEGKSLPPRGQSVHYPIDTKDILGIGVSWPDRIDTIAGGPRANFRVRGLIPSSSITAGSVQYNHELSFANNANVVAEGAAKPKSDKTFDLVSMPVQVIAHYFKVSRQSFEDVQQLPGHLEANLLYGLESKLEQQLLKGTGITPELRGLLTVAVAAAGVTAATSMPDRLMLATAELAGKGFTPSGIVMSAADYVAMSMLKNTQGDYIFSAVPALPPIVTSPFLAAGEWLVADFSQTRLFVREDSTIMVGAQNEDDFTKNMYTVLAEIRCALVVFQSAAVIRNGTVTA